MSFFDFMSDRFNTYSVYAPFSQCVEKLDKPCVEHHLPNISNELLKKSNYIIDCKLNTNKLWPQELRDISLLLKEESNKRNI